MCTLQYITYVELEELKELGGWGRKGVFSTRTELFKSFQVLLLHKHINYHRCAQATISTFAWPQLLSNTSIYTIIYSPPRETFVHKIALSALLSFFLLFYVTANMKHFFWKSRNICWKNELVSNFWWNFRLIYSMINLRNFFIFPNQEKLEKDNP